MVCLEESSQTRSEEVLSDCCKAGESLSSKRVEVEECTEDLEDKGKAVKKKIKIRQTAQA